MELSEAEIAQLKEHNQRRVKRVVAIVAITMTLISIVLVALSLSLGSKIDQLEPYRDMRRKLSFNNGTLSFRIPENLLHPIDFRASRYSIIYASSPLPLTDASIEH
uniref:Uncharacterized protein n=1 Tax=Parascaris equorum TaxID=6256 RepID=A0A914RZ15_PAREQ